MIMIREALPPDAGALAELLRRSITELCGADHRNDPSLIARWTANKTPDQVGRWIAGPGTALLVAEADGVPVGVGGLGADGVILLNYVHPDWRFRGVSRALLRHLEEMIAGQGVAAGRLTSTLTAHRFYLTAGWIDAGPPESGSGLTGFPMRKPMPVTGRD